MMDILKRFVELESKKTKLQSELNKIKKELESIEPVARSYMLDNSIQSMNIEGRTAYLKEDVFIKLLTEKREVAQALIEAGLNDFVREDFNIRTLTAYFREMLSNNEPIPKQLSDKVEVGKVIKLRSRSK